jgi:hypothetical protein
MFICNRDVGSKRGIRRNNIYGTQWDILLCILQIRQVTKRKLQRIDVIYVTPAIARQNHMHLGGLDQERIEISSKDFCFCVCLQPLMDG